MKKEVTAEIGNVSFSFDPAKQTKTQAYLQEIKRLENAQSDYLKQQFGHSTPVPNELKPGGHKTSGGRVSKGSGKSYTPNPGPAVTGFGRLINEVNPQKFTHNEPPFSLGDYYATEYLEHSAATPEEKAFAKQIKNAVRSDPGYSAWVEGDNHVARINTPSGDIRVEFGNKDTGLKILQWDQYESTPPPKELDGRDIETGFDYWPD